MKMLQFSHGHFCKTGNIYDYILSILNQMLQTCLINNQIPADRQHIQLTELLIYILNFFLSFNIIKYCNLKKKIN